MDPSNIENELSIARDLLDAARESNPSLANSLLSTIAKLAAEHDRQSARRSLFLHRNVVLRLALDLSEAVTDELRQHLPEETVNEIADRLIVGMQASILAASNSKQEIKEIAKRSHSE